MRQPFKPKALTTRMSRALSISLMLLTAALCGVCVVQWQRELRAAARERTLQRDLAEATASQQRLTDQLATRDQEIARLHAALVAAATPPAPPADLTGALAQKTTALAELTATHTALQAQLTKALDERDAMATRLNQRTQEYNTLAARLKKKP